MIRHDRVEKLEDGDHHAAVISSGTWLGPDQQVLLKEKRRTALRPLEDGSYLLLLDLHLQAVLPEVTFGKTPFGLVGVRMAKTLGVHDGGGRILNSEGSINEEGVFWKPAKWVDYAGLIAPERVEGITLMDHPANPNHPTVFHVRNDGWMGASLTFHEDRVLQKERHSSCATGCWFMPSGWMCRDWTPATGHSLSYHSITSIPESAQASPSILRDGRSSNPLTMSIGRVPDGRHRATLPDPCPAGIVLYGHSTAWVGRGNRRGLPDGKW